MSVDNAILFKFIITLLSLNIGNTLAECVTSTACTCVMSNGEGWDLSKITDPGDDFIQSTTLSNRTLYFHPCRNKVLKNQTVANTTKNTCNSDPGVSLCLFNTTSKDFLSLGTVQESKWVLKSPETPEITIIHNDADKHTVVTVQLICNPNNGSTLLSEDPNESIPPNYKLMLVSNHACKKPMHTDALSTGSVLVIIFFVLSGLYFAGGALALKLLRGATGWEMLPNQKFWFDLPVLVRDGIAFTFNGCKVVSYDQI